MTVQEWLKVSWNMTNTKIRPWALCNDGYEISIQASAYHYSNPRVDGASEYTEVELGFPNEPDDAILEYAEDPGMPTDTDPEYQQDDEEHLQPLSDCQS